MNSEEQNSLSLLEKICGSVAFTGLCLELYGVETSFYGAVSNNSRLMESGLTNAAYGMIPLALGLISFDYINRRRKRNNERN